MFGLFDLHAGFGAGVGAEDEEVLATGTGGEHHAFGDAKAHLARGEVGNHKGEAALEVFGAVGGFDAGKDVAGLAAQVEGELYQFVGAFDRAGFGDAGDAQVYLGEVVDVDGVGDGVFGQGAVHGCCLL